MLINDIPHTQVLREAFEDLTCAVWFAKEIVHVCGQHARTLRCVSRSGYSGDLHFCPAIEFADAPRHFSAIHAGHAQIRPDELRSPLPKDFNCLRATRGDLHLESGFPQEALQEAAIVGVVVNHKNAEIGLPVFKDVLPRKLRSCYIFLLPLNCRNFNVEDRARARGASNANTASQHFHELACDRQSETCAPFGAMICPPEQRARKYGSDPRD